MSYIPADLFTIQDTWHQTLGTPAPANGVIGGHRSDSYHQGVDVLRRWGKAPEQLGAMYAVMESLRDRGGLTLAASAIDLPTPTQALRDVITQVVELARHGDNRCRDLRAVRYSPDGRLCWQWDALDPPGPLRDTTHLRFAHLAFYRDAEGHRAERDNLGGLLTDLLAEACQPAAGAHSAR